MDLQKIKKAHFIGVSGIGVSALLRLFASRGIVVSGTDLALPDVGTLPAGEYHEGHDAEYVPSDADIVIYSPAAPESNIERMTARAMSIPELSYPEALALIGSTHHTIAISGTHGKSTTTALMGKFFEAGGFDPLVIVGAEVPGWQKNLRLPEKESSEESGIFIVEACEYRRAMMNLSPQTIVLTNLELDHPDYYKDLADIKNAFREYIGKLSGEDLLVINNDDANIRDIVQNFDGILVRYGVGEGADLIARNIKATESGQTFELIWKGTSLGVLATTLPGLYNIYNILAATAVYLAYGGKSDLIPPILLKFEGIGRRFEVLGKLGNATIISDYAHHPTALAAVTEATALRFPDKRILTIFRPHHRDRTLKLFDQFLAVVANIPHMILVEIYDVPGREEGITISSKDMIAKVLERNPNAHLSFASNLEEAEQIARTMENDFDVMLVVGAGDADLLAKRLLK